MVSTGDMAPTFWTTFGLVRQIVRFLQSGGVAANWFAVSTDWLRAVLFVVLVVVEAYSYGFLIEFQTGRPNLGVYVGVAASLRVVSRGTQLAGA